MIQGIIEILKENTGVQNLVGLNVTSERYKIYPVRYPQKEGKETDIDESYITVYKTGSSPEQSKDFSSGLDLVSFNVNCYASNYPGAYNLYEAVRLALDNRDLEYTTEAGFIYNGIYMTTDYDAYDDSALRYIHVASFSCHVKRTQTGR